MAGGPQRGGPDLHRTAAGWGCGGEGGAKHFTLLQLGGEWSKSMNGKETGEEQGFKKKVFLVSGKQNMNKNKRNEGKGNHTNAMQALACSRASREAERLQERGREKWMMWHI